MKFYNLGNKTFEVMLYVSKIATIEHLEKCTYRANQPLGHQEIPGNHQNIIPSNLRTVKATLYSTIFMRGMRAKRKIQKNNYQYRQRGQSFAGKSSSLSLIAFLHTRNIAE